MGSFLLDLLQNVDWHSRWHHSARSSFKSLRAAAQVPAVCANIWPIPLSIFCIFNIVTSAYWPLLCSRWFGIEQQITFSLIWMWSSTSAQNKEWLYIKDLPSCLHLTYNVYSRIKKIEMRDRLVISVSLSLRVLAHKTHRCHCLVCVLHTTHKLRPVTIIKQYCDVSTWSALRSLILDRSTEA